jgi:hypothetical protein
MIKELVAKAKEFGCIEAFWGMRMHVTEVATYDTTAMELKRLTTTVNHHTNYQCSMIVELLKGVADVDDATSYHMPEGGVQGEVTLRDVLLRYYKMSNGNSLIAEIHQRVMTSLVEAVYPASEEAETMIAKMNRHLLAFVYNYFVDKGLNKKFVIDLLKKNCCPMLVMVIPNCKWDSELMTITTPDDENDDELYMKLESAIWIEDEVGPTKNGKKKKGYLDPELLYYLDGDCSIKTLYECNDKACCSKDVAESDLEGDEEEEKIMSQDSTSKNNHTKLH